MYVLRTRASDDKVNVRRAALQLLEHVVTINRAIGQEEVGYNLIISYVVA